MSKLEERILLEKEIRKVLTELLLFSASKLNSAADFMESLQKEETDQKLRMKWYRLKIICEMLEQQQKRNTRLLQDGGAFALTYEATKQLPAKKT
jgi:hypothetical protein